MDKLLAQVKHDASTGDEAARKKLLQGLRDLAFSIETPEDTIQRVMFEVESDPSSKFVYSLKINKVYSISKSLWSAWGLTSSSSAS